MEEEAVVKKGTSYVWIKIELERTNLLIQKRHEEWKEGALYYRYL
jgi:hypothetical protein